MTTFGNEMTTFGDTGAAAFAGDGKDVAAAALSHPVDRIFYDSFALLRNCNFPSI